MTQAVEAGSSREKFVIAGDQNSDPLDGDSIPGDPATARASAHQRRSRRRARAPPRRRSCRAGSTRPAAIRFDTADFADNAPGNLRADYVLPRKNLQIVDGAVFWPVQASPLFPLTGVFPFPSSDHRAVWIDVQVPS